MRYLVSGLGAIAALLLMLAAGWMNWRFMTSLATDEADGFALGLASIGVDLMKAALAYLMALAWDRRQWGYLVVGSVSYAMLAMVSLASSFGFAVESRDAVLSGRSALTARHQAAAAELGEVEAKVKAYGTARASSIIASEIASLEKEPRWRATKGCRAIRGTENSAFCKRYSERTSEFAAARVVEALDGRRGELRKTLTELSDRGALRATDRQTRYAAAMGIREETLRHGLALLLASVMELGGGLGLYLACRPVSRERRRQERATADGHLTWGNPPAADPTMNGQREEQRRRKRLRATIAFPHNTAGGEIDPR